MAWGKMGKPPKFRHKQKVIVNDECTLDVIFYDLFKKSGEIKSMGVDDYGDVEYNVSFGDGLHARIPETCLVRKGAK
jgi:hypothetical protein